MNDQEQVKLLCNIFGIGTLDFSYFVDRIEESGVDREELADWINDQMLDYIQSRRDFDIDLNGMLYVFVINKICTRCDCGEDEVNNLDILSSTIMDTVAVYSDYLDTSYDYKEEDFYKNYCQNFLSSRPQYIEYADKESFLRSNYIATVSRFLSMCEESEEFNKLVEFVGIKEFLSREISES